MNIPARVTGLELVQIKYAVVHAPGLLALRGLYFIHSVVLYYYTITVSLFLVELVGLVYICDKSL